MAIVFGLRDYDVGAHGGPMVYDIEVHCEQLSVKELALPRSCRYISFG